MLIILMRRLRRVKYKKRFWVGQIYQDRKAEGEFHSLVREAMLFGHEFFLSNVSNVTHEV